MPPSQFPKRDCGRTQKITGSARVGAAAIEPIAAIQALLAGVDLECLLAANSSRSRLPRIRQKETRRSGSLMSVYQEWLCCFTSHPTK
jgi:hypothetical protein